MTSAERTWRPGGNPLATLRRIAVERPRPVEGERCEMCAEPVSQTHQHVVDLDSRALLCTCRACYLLFTAPGAAMRYRAVPDRYLWFASFSLGPAQWDALEIPVGLAFFFTNSRLGRVVAFYPGPAGAAESELPLGAWDTVLAANPGLTTVAADVEALLVSMPDGRGRPGHDGSAARCHLVPVDSCYELVGRLRRVWRGFDGGQDARREIDDYFASVEARSRRVDAGDPPGGGAR